MTKFSLCLSATHGILRSTMFRIALILGLVCVMATSVVTALPKDRADFVVEPFLGKATPTSMHIAWETSTNASTAVEYGISKSLGLSCLVKLRLSLR